MLVSRCEDLGQMMGERRAAIQEGGNENHSQLEVVRGFPTFWPRSSHRETSMNDNHYQLADVCLVNENHYHLFLARCN